MIGLESRVRALEVNLTDDEPKNEEGGRKRVDIQAKPNHKWRGRIFLDHLMLDDSAALGLRSNETGFDTARIGVEGNVFEVVKYKFEVEFEGLETDFKDVYMEATELAVVGNFRGGHYKEPYGLEELTSSRFVTFLE